LTPEPTLFQNKKAKVQLMVAAKLISQVKYWGVL